MRTPTQVRDKMSCSKRIHKFFRSTRRAILALRFIHKLSWLFYYRNMPKMFLVTWNWKLISMQRKIRIWYWQKKYFGLQRNDCIKMSNKLSLENTSFSASKAVRFCSTELLPEGKLCTQVGELLSVPHMIHKHHFPPCAIILYGQNHQM